MFTLTPILVALIVIVVVLASRRRNAEVPTPTGRPRPSSSLTDGLNRWRQAGLVSPEQFDAIIDFERHRAVDRAHQGTVERTAVPHSPRRALLAEALGYLGAILATVGALLLTAQFWPDLAFGWRLAVTGASSAALLLAGALVPDQEGTAMQRLRWMLWLAATALAAVFAGLITVDGLEASAAATTAAVGGTIAVVSGTLWLGRARPVQQLTFLGAAPVFVGAVGSIVAGDGVAGLVVWISGVVVLTVGVARWGAPPSVFDLFGSSTAMIGALIAAGKWQGPGLLLAVATALGIGTLALLSRSARTRGEIIALSIVAAIATPQAAAPAIAYFSREAGGASGLITTAIGVTVLIAAFMRQTRAPLFVESLGAIAILVGAAVTGRQWPDAAPILGLGVALVFVALGIRFNDAPLMIVGAIGVLVFSLWVVRRLFPTHGLVPLILVLGGAVLVAVAVRLIRPNRITPRTPRNPGLDR